MRSLVFLLCSIVPMSVGAGTRTETWNGWFSDRDCAVGRASGGVYTATNPDCARQCIEKGVPVVFIAEQQKSLYVVKGYATAKDEIGYKLAVTGSFDEAAKTVTVNSVKRLEPVVPACGRPKH